MSYPTPAKVEVLHVALNEESGKEAVVTNTCMGFATTTRNLNMDTSKSIFTHYDTMADAISAADQFVN